MRPLAILQEVIADESDHYRTLGSLIPATPAGTGDRPKDAKTALEDLLNARRKGQHEAAGWVGDAIYGINDGLGSIFGIVSGVARPNLELTPHSGEAVQGACWAASLLSGSRFMTGSHGTYVHHWLF